MLLKNIAAAGGHPPGIPGWSRARTILLILVAFVLATPLADASWFQAGSDAARTGIIPEPGPAFGDTAFVVRLPGSVYGTLAIDNGWIYAVTSDYGHPGGQEAVWRVETATAAVEHLFDLPEGASRHDSIFDEERLILFDGRAIVSMDRQTGQELGRWALPFVAESNRIECSEPALADGSLFVACVYRPPTSIGDIVTNGSHAPRQPGDSGTMVVASLDPATLEPNWVSEPEPTAGLQPDPDDPERVPAGRFPRYISLSVGAGRVILYTSTGFHSTLIPEPRTMVNHNGFMVWSLDVDDGHVEWTVYGEQSQGVRVDDHPPVSDLRSPDGIQVGTLPLIGPDAIYLRMETVRALNIATGDTIWSEEVGQADSFDVPGGSGFGLSGDALLATSIQTAYRFDPVTGEPAWESRLPPASTYHYSGSPVAVDGVRAYFGTIGCDGEEQMRGIRAIDVASGELQWEQQQTERKAPLPYYCWGNGPSAHSGGIIAYGLWDGRLIVLGQAEVSLRVPGLPAAAYPAVGSTVAVDLSATTAGIDGPATRFMAEWGDGTTTDWQASPLLTHVYNESGEKHARFVAANDYQTSTAVVTYHVGGTPPREPNLIETMFARENQDLTFGILGILVALAGGLVALLARRHKRGILQRELDAIDHAYRSTLADPIACDAALVARQAHCRGLLMDGRIDEPQFTVLSGRIGELARGMRLSTLDHRFRFLPYGMVLALRDMLADGRITTWERQHVLRALDEDVILTQRQKDKVRRLVDEWFERDRVSTSGPGT